MSTVSITSCEVAVNIAHDRARSLRDASPGWAIWQSAAGHWYAVDQTVTMTQIVAGCQATVDAKELDTLAEQLAEQIQKRAAVTP